VLEKRVLELRIDGKAFVSPDGVRRSVLGHVAFSVAAGEVVGLLGASGIGKSTILRIALGLDAAFDGTVRRGTERVGVMFQEPRLLPWLTVGDNLRVVGKDGMPTPDIGALLDAVRLPNAEALYPRQLSLGMARRASLARALAVSPELLVLDEPFASLDPQLAAALGSVVAGWARRTGAAVLLATHDLGQALAFVSRLLVLSGQPATLAADLPVRAEDGPARAALHASMVDTFGFLDTGAGQGECEGGSEVPG